MQLLEITITGIGPIALTAGIALAVGFGIGWGVYNNNVKLMQAKAAAAESHLQDVQNELSKVKATATTVVNDVKKG